MQPNGNAPDRAPQVQSVLDAIVLPTKILAVEDDPVSAKLLAVLLAHYGYDVVTASDGDEAWKLFRADPVRIVVSDWMMPGSDGLELCRNIRGQDRLPYTYFILLTANRTSSENYALATDAGVDDFLTKPIDREALQMRLRVAERILSFTAEIRQLKQIIPICVYCRKVRDEDNYWDRVETYIQKETGSRFSHGACPDCCEKEVADFTAGMPAASGQS